MSKSLIPGSSLLADELESSKTLARTLRDMGLSPNILDDLHGSGNMVRDALGGVAMQHVRDILDPLPSYGAGLLSSTADMSKAAKTSPFDTLGALREMQVAGLFTTRLGFPSAAGEALHAMGVAGAQRKMSTLFSAAATNRIFGVLPNDNERFLGSFVNTHQAWSADLSAVMSLTHNLTGNPDFLAMLSAAQFSKGLSAFEDYTAIGKALGSLPPWLRPASVDQAFLPSWEVTATLGVAGFGRPSLLQDTLASLHAARVHTTGFEAVVQMMEVADEAGEDLAERVLDVLRLYASAIVELLAQAKSWIARQGLMSTLMFILTAASYYETHLSRIDADQQTKLARASSAPASLAAQHELTKQIETIEQRLAYLQQEQSPDHEARLVVRPAALRATPDQKGIILRQLYPDDRVRVLDVQGGWAQVEVYQFHSETVIEGWMSRRALRLPER